MICLFAVRTTSNAGAALVVSVVLLHALEAEFVGGCPFFLGSAASLERPTFSWPMTGSTAEFTGGDLSNRHLRGVDM